MAESQRPRQPLPFEHWERCHATSSGNLTNIGCESFLGSVWVRDWPSCVDRHSMSVTHSCHLPWTVCLAQTVSSSGMALGSFFMPKKVSDWIVTVYNVARTARSAIGTTACPRLVPGTIGLHVRDTHLSPDSTGTPHHRGTENTEKVRSVRERSSPAWNRPPSASPLSPPPISLSLRPSAVVAALGETGSRSRSS